MEISATVLVLALAAVALSTFVQFATGSGFGILGGPLLLLIDPSLVPATLLLLTVVVMAAVVWTERRGLTHVDLGWAALGAVPAAIAAVWLVRVMDQQITELVVGVAIAGGAVAGLTGWTVRQTRSTLIVAGVLGGALSTIAASPGPPVIVVYRTEDVSRYRGNLSLFFLVTSLVSLGTLVVSGDLGRSDLTAAVWLLPAIGLGALVAKFVVRKIPGSRIRPAALALCLVSAVGLIGGALAG